MEEQGARRATAAPRSMETSARVAVNRAAGVAAPDRAARAPKRVPSRDEDAAEMRVDARWARAPIAPRGEPRAPADGLTIAPRVTAHGWTADMMWRRGARLGCGVDKRR